VVEAAEDIRITMGHDSYCCESSNHEYGKRSFDGYSREDGRMGVSLPPHPFFYI
jgi:hypothetical protein